MLFRIHKEGYALLAISAIILVILNYAILELVPGAFWPVLVLSMVFYGIILQFFRNPVRIVPTTDNHIIYAPADGKVCVIEETIEKR